MLVTATESKYKLKSDILLWTLTHERTGVGQPATLCGYWMQSKGLAERERERDGVREREREREGWMERERETERERERERDGRSERERKRMMMI